MEAGQFHVYTGNGKGKTTSAIGLAVRALGAGKRVYFGQFIKDTEYSEIKVLKELKGIVVEQFGTGKGCLVGRDRETQDVECAAEGIKRIKEALASGKYDIVIADEINVAYMLNLISEDDWRDCAAARPDDVELIYTGRGAPACALETADLMTEMCEIKHYYNTKGLIARKGVEC